MRMSPLRRPALAALVAVALLACDDGGSPTGPIDSPILVDRAGTLEAQAGATDTIEVIVPEGRVMGAIIETNSPILLRYGTGQFDVVHSGFGGAFAAIVPQAGTGAVRLLVRRSTIDVVEVTYRVRIVAVDDAPEHRDAAVSGTAFHGDWIDPPLDRDVFTIELASGDVFVVDFETGSGDVRATAVLVEPTGVPHYLFLEAGSDLMRSAPLEARLTGEHQLIVYSTGLEPDVETSYRFRVVKSA